MIQIGTICYIKGNAECKSCDTLAGRVVTVVGRVNSEVARVSPPIPTACRPVYAEADTVYDRYLIPIVPPGLTEKEDKSEKVEA